MKYIILIFTLLLIYKCSYGKNNLKESCEKLFLSVKGDTLPKYLFFSVETINGNKINTKDQDNKIIVLNFWFIACAPCRNELEQLNSLSRRYKNDPEVIFISISSMDGKDQLKFVKQRTGFNYHMVASRPDICRQFNVSLYPTNIILRNGKIISSVVGYHKNIGDIQGKIIDSLKRIF